MTTGLDRIAEPAPVGATEDGRRRAETFGREDSGPVRPESPRPSGSGGAEGPAGVRFHRPARAWPLPAGTEPIALMPPPSNRQGDAGGLLMTVLPLMGTLSMVAFAFIERSLIYIVIIGIMVMAMVATGLGTRLLQQRRDRRQWSQLYRRYLDHVDDTRIRAEAAADIQRAGLEGLYPDTADLWGLVQAGEGIWERRPGDPDFASVRVGLGSVAAARPVVISGSENPLGEPDPDLAQAAADLVAATAHLGDSPVVIPLARVGTVALVGPPGPSRELVSAWVASLATFHAPGELRVAGYVPVETARSWDWMKWLPHTRDPRGGEGFGRARRAVTTDLGVFAEQVEAITRPRLHRAQLMGGPDGGGPFAAVAQEHVVLVVDGYHPDAPVASTEDLELLMANAAALGVTVVVITESAAHVPPSCGARLSINERGVAQYVEHGPSGRVETGVRADRVQPAAALALARRLAPLRLASGGMDVDFADSVRLVELLGVDDAANLDPPREWLSLADLRSGTHRGLLRAALGRREDGQVVQLDLKEAAADGMGPHGILVGATGSGKSELLRSLVAALAAGHDPALLNLLLIDFKGGAAFAELAELPHVAGLVTNLADQTVLIDRVQQALVGELERRQLVLKAAGVESVRAYHRRLAEDPELPALPYLVIVVDEFGELLTARPEFIDTFNAIGRLGRSLGMHLLLSTQRLDEGRVRALDPHLRYRLCLRTYTAEESRAVLGSSVAFELPALPGLGYLRVDSTMTRFKTGLITLRRHALDLPASPETVAVRPLSLTPPVPSTAATPHESPETDLDILVQRIVAAAPTPARPVWLEPLPDTLNWDEVRCRFDGDEGGSGALLGLVDVPERQTQEPLRYDFSGSGGNLGIAGAPRTGKSTLLRTALLSLVQGRTPEQVQFYCLDLGGGGLFDLDGLPHVGALIGRGEPEATARLLRELQAVLDERSMSQRAGRGAAVPEVFLVIDNVGLLKQTMPDLEPMVTHLATAGLQYGVHVVVTSNRWFDIRPQLLDALGTRLELRLGDPAESVVRRAVAATVPAGQPGRGITTNGQFFQAAVVADQAEVVEAARHQARGARAPSITGMPEVVRTPDVPALAAAAGSAPPAPSGRFLLGVSEFRCRPVELDLMAPGGHLLGFGEPGSGRTTLLARAVHHLARTASPEQVQIHVVDPSHALAELADSLDVASYAATSAAAGRLADRLGQELGARVPTEDLSPRQVRQGRSWRGPDHVVVVDDYDRLLGAMGGPFGELVDLLGSSSEIGLHVLLTRRVAGAQRTAYEPFGQRLRETATTLLILSGSSEEGPLAAGVTPRPLPPGRGILVTPSRHPQMVQCCTEAAVQGS